MRLIAENLAVARGGETLVSNVSFSLAEGEALVVTGPNGSGKSTLLRTIAGLLPVADGAIRLEGANETIADCSHYLGHLNAMKPALSVRENLAFWQSFLGEPHLSVPGALEMVGLEETADLPFGYLSTGQRRRVAIARLLVSDRPVWLLDEPTAGLDAGSETGFGELMAAHLADGGIIVAATHQPLGLENAAQLALEFAR